MIVQALRRKKRQQGGFTLIELLVVIAILGILAAIVSISLLGVTAAAKNSALKAEKQTIQGAFDAMMADQHVDPSQLTACVHVKTAADPANYPDNLWTSAANTGPYTDNMQSFPPGGATYAPPDPTTGGVVTVLATHYIRETRTPSAWYACDQEGNVFQHSK
jgi:general secretion pathway protein G